MKKIDTTLTLRNAINDESGVFDYIIEGQTVGIMCAYDVIWQLFGCEVGWRDRPQTITVRVTSAKPRNRKRYSKLTLQVRTFGYYEPRHLWIAESSVSKDTAVIMDKASDAITQLFGDRTLYVQAVSSLKSR